MNCLMTFGGGLRLFLKPARLRFNDSLTLTIADDCSRTTSNFPRPTTLTVSYQK